MIAILNDKKLEQIIGKKFAGFSKADRFAYRKVSDLSGFVHIGGWIH